MLPQPPPLRTGHASFPTSGSSTWLEAAPPGNEIYALLKDDKGNIHYKMYNPNQDETHSLDTTNFHDFYFDLNRGFGRGEGMESLPFRLRLNTFEYKGPKKIVEEKRESVVDTEITETVTPVEDDADMKRSKSIEIQKIMKAQLMESKQRESENENNFIASPGMGN